MKILALYLPQFHVIPENDEWWGKGFTEWVNVKKARPLFEGHYQPRIPLNENYYNLLDNSVKKWQIDLAKEHGIYGFCVYHYWFCGKKLLEKPMEQYLADKSLDFPFCFCWANEHWSNAWVSGENKILMAQNFEDREDWDNHFYYMLPFFQDERYIKEDGKPLYVIYLPNIIGPLNEMIDRWQELAKQNGLPGIKFISQSPFWHLDNNADKSRFDYSIEFQPSMINHLEKGKQGAKWVRWKTKLSLFLQNKLHIYVKLPKKKVHRSCYDDKWKQVLAIHPQNDSCIPGAFVDWDNTPRKGERGDVYVGASPEKFKHYFDLQVKHVKREYKTDWLVMFAWNEWAEGGILEPTERYGTGYLEAIRDVLLENEEFPTWDGNK